MSAIVVRKHTWRGVFRYAWHGGVAQRRPDHLVIVAIWKGPGEPAVGELRFVPGDRFVEHYYPGRGYAIWQVEEPNGTVKGWYCNISTPLIETADTLSFDDLLLDILVYPDGRYVILDRDEFEAARAEGLSDERAALAEGTLVELLALIQAADPPFSFAPGTARAVDP